MTNKGTLGTNDLVLYIKAKILTYNTSWFTDITHNPLNFDIHLKWISIIIHSVFQQTLIKVFALLSVRCRKVGGTKDMPSHLLRSKVISSICARKLGEGYMETERAWCKGDSVVPPC